jgi:hypothetical protein
MVYTTVQSLIIAYSCLPLFLIALLAPIFPSVKSASHVDLGNVMVIGRQGGGTRWMWDK